MFVIVPSLGAGRGILSAMRTILTPTLWKIALALALFLFFTWLWRVLVTIHLMDLFPLGFPLAFYYAWGPCPPQETCQETRVWSLAFDLAFWYATAGVALWARQRKTKGTSQ